MKIMVEATREKEILGGIEYRIYRGHTASGIQVEMLGLIRIKDPLKRAEFTREVCAVSPADASPVWLLSAEGLINP